MKRSVVVGMGIVCLLIVLVFGFRFTLSKQVGGFGETQGSKVKGPPNASITIDEFSDFQCPSCSFAQEALKKIITSFPDLVKLTFHHYPLPMHPHAFDASMFAECSAEQNKFWPYQDALFREQKIWSGDPDAKTLFLAYANDVAIDRQKLIQCLNQPATKEKIEQDVQKGKELQVNSTPTFFVNNERVVGSLQMTEKVYGLIHEKAEAMSSKK